MDEAAGLYGILLAFYVLESCWRVAPRSLAFRRQWRGGYLDDPPPVAMAAFSMALSLPDRPWPRNERWHVERIPLLPTPWGVLVEDGSGFAPYEAVDAIAARGHRVVLPGSGEHGGYDARRVEHAIAAARRFAVLSAPQRAEAIEKWWAETLDTEAARTRAEQLRRWGRGLLPLSMLAALLIVIGIPAFIALFGLASSWKWLLLAHGGIAAALSFATIWISRRGMGEIRLPWVEAVATAALIPGAVPWLIENLWRHAFADLHVIALADAVLTGERFARRGRLECARLRGEATSEPHASAIAWVSERLKSAVAAGLARRGESPADYAAPSCIEDGATHYCAACHAQYRTPPERCGECAELEFIVIEAKGRERARKE